MRRRTSRRRTSSKRAAPRRSSQNRYSQNNDVQIYRHAIIDALQVLNLGRGAYRRDVIPHIANYMELEFDDDVNRSLVDRARAELVNEGLMYPADPYRRGWWELTPEGWDR